MATTLSLEEPDGVAYCTPVSVWKMMRDLEDVTAFRTRLPEEFYDEFDQIVRSLLCSYCQALADIETLHLRFHEKEIDLTSEEKALIFLRRRPRYLEELEEPGKTRTAVYNMFRPD